MSVSKSVISAYVPTGASFPSPASFGNFRPFFRTDLGDTYYYDGTRWMTGIHDWLSGDGTARSASEFVCGFPVVGQDIYVIDFAWTFLVNSTHSSTQYWEAKLSNFDGANATTLTSDKSTVGSWVVPSATSINSALTSTKGMEINVIKISTPGTLLANFKMRYRVIAT